MQNPITQIRHEQQWTRSEFARQAGVNLNTISALERGKRASISDKTACKLAAATGILMSQFQLAYLLWKSDPTPETEPTTQRCSKCKQVKSLVTGFHKNARSSNGHHGICKECRNPYNRVKHREYYRRKEGTPPVRDDLRAHHYERIVQQRTHRYQHGPMLPTERDGQLYSPNNKPISADGGEK